MKCIKNEAACVCYDEGIGLDDTIKKLCRLVKNYPFIITPFSDIDNDINRVFAAKGFHLYPTYEKTTVFYDPDTDCFFKIIHPLHIKNRIFSLVTDKSRSIYNLAESLYAKGVKVQRVVARGTFTKDRLPFYAIKKSEGESLYDLLIGAGKNISIDMYRKVMDEVAKLHLSGYWFGDAHLSHIFTTDEEVSGFIDIDGIRKNRPYMLKNLAKDIAGLNHPALPLTEDEKRAILNYYLHSLDITEEERFLEMLKYYTERRWKD